MRLAFSLHSWLLAGLLLCLAGAACSREDELLATALPPGSIAEGRIKGVTLDARRAPDAATLLHLRDLGVTYIALIPMGFQPSHDTPEIRHDPDARWFSESDAGIRALARQADSLGMEVVIKPHMWAGDFRSGKLPSDIGFAREAEWKQWEEEYRSYILHYAHLSQEIGTPLLCIGTELARAARERPAFWRSLIGEIRAIYDGPLTYAANWYGEYEHIEFWDALDYIGVQAYFPISTRDDPSLDVLKKGWTAHRRELLKLSRRVGKPVLFTEIGYRSIFSAAREPWLWPTREEVGIVPPDFELQSRLYQAFFETVWQDPMFAGALIWEWYPHNSRSGPGRALDFTPQDKPAEQVISQWFRADEPQATAGEP